MKQLPLFKLPDLKTFPSKIVPYKTPIIFGSVVIVFVLLFTVGQQYEWIGVGEDETVVTVREPSSTPTPDFEGYVVKTVTTTSQSGKTLWDILSLIGVPASLALLGWWLQVQQQRQSDVALREEALKEYIDAIAALLIEKNLIAIATKVKLAEKKQVEQDESKVEPTASQVEPAVQNVVSEGSSDGGTTAGVVNKPSKVEVTEEQQELLDAAKDVIQARTLSILRRLGDDIERKTAVIQFLADADVVEKVGLNLSRIDLKGIDLSGANLQGIQLVDAQLEGADLIGADLRSAYLYRADLSNTNLAYVGLAYADLSNAKLSDAYLYCADLSNANLRSANLRSADLSGANLEHADLSGANLEHADLIGTKLSNANLSDANLRSANLSAKLEGADLSGANLILANFFAANLSDANLSGTKLIGADFLGADLSGADFSNAILLFTDLRNTIGLTQEQLEGTNPPLLCNAVLPKEVSDIDPNRDCDQFLHVLYDKGYPDEFKTLRGTKAYIEKARKARQRL